MASARKTFGSSLIQDGENPNGCISQTADSTVRNYDALGPQEWKWNQSADGPRWNEGFSPKIGLEAVAQPVRRKRK